jgi:pyruvate-formate lyase
VGSPDAALNVLKALDVTLHNGVDSFSGKRMGLALGPFESFATFDVFRYAFARQLEHQVGLLADAQSTIYRTTGAYAAFPALSLLYDDCIATAKPILGGGVRYLGGTIETFGNNSAADALSAIKTVVYDNKEVTHARLLEMIANDFEGFENERRKLISLPKFGNDMDQADDQVVWINRILYSAAKLQTECTLLDTFLVVNINNGDSVLHGKKTAASADGRKAGEPLSNGNQPSAGNDLNGITALLNSMAKVPAEIHAGMTHNMKLSRRMLVENGEQTKALVRGYFNNGGTQLMITTVEKGELMEAIRQPEKYRHIFVRVGGYSERFVDLPRDIQREVMERTLYD